MSDQNRTGRCHFKLAFNELLDQASLKARRSEVSLRQRLGDALSVGRALFPYIVASVPEIVVGALGRIKKKDRSATGWNLAYRQPAEFDAVVVPHSLSPRGDSVFLLADFGRALRVSTVLQKKLLVLTADPTWSRYNWVISELGDQNLHLNLSWRKGLADSVGAEMRVCGFENMAVSSHALHLEATAYVQMAEALLGADVSGRSLSDIECTQSLRQLEGRGDSPSAKILGIEPVRKVMRAELSVLRNVIERFSRVDHNTFLYFLAQRYHQWSYAKCLKVAISREKAFDEPFDELDSYSSEDGRKGIQNALYFADYEIALSDKNWVTVHPYCFPSGSAYSQLGSVNGVREICIHLEDLADAALVERKFELLPYPHNARLVADVLSFIHHFCVQSSARRSLFGETGRALEAVSEGWGHSWKFYGGQKKKARERMITWGESFLSKWRDTMPLPFYYYPFMILESKAKSPAVAEALSKIVGRLATENQISPPTYPASS